MGERKYSLCTHYRSQAVNLKGKTVPRARINVNKTWCDGSQAWGTATPHGQDWGGGNTDKIYLDVPT